MSSICTICIWQVFHKVVPSNSNKIGAILMQQEQLEGPGPRQQLQEGSSCRASPDRKVNAYTCLELFPCLYVMNLRTNFYSAQSLTAVCMFVEVIVCKITATSSFLNAPYHLEV